MEWPWTYEVDLLEAQPLRRIRVCFAERAYATRVRLSVSVDREAWLDVDTIETPAGEPVEVVFEPVEARYVRVSALEPNGPDQPGEQMAVAELEVYP